LDAAQTVTAAARQQAQEIGVPTNIAVVDEGNNLVAFARMDGAWLGSIDTAPGRAFTARAFDMGTDALAPLCQPGQPLFGIHASNQGRLMVFPGTVRSRQTTPQSARSGSAAAPSTRTSRSRKQEQQLSKERSDDDQRYAQRASKEALLERGHDRQELHPPALVGKLH